MKTAWIQAGAYSGSGVGTIQNTKQYGRTRMRSSRVLRSAPSVTGVSFISETTPSAPEA